MHILIVFSSSYSPMSVDNIPIIFEIDQYSAYSFISIHIPIYPIIFIHSSIMFHLSFSVLPNRSPEPPFSSRLKTVALAAAATSAAAGRRCRCPQRSPRSRLRRSLTPRLGRRNGVTLTAVMFICKKGNQHKVWGNGNLICGEM